MAHMTLDLAGGVSDLDPLPFAHDIHNITDTEYVPHGAQLPCL